MEVRLNLQFFAGKQEATRRHRLEAKAGNIDAFQDLTSAALATDMKVYFVVRGGQACRKHAPDGTRSEDGDTHENPHW